MSKPPSSAKKPVVKKSPAKRSPARQATAATKTRRVRVPRLSDEIQPTDPYVEALAAAPQRGSFEPEVLPQPIVDWQPAHSRDEAPHAPRIGLRPISPPRALSAGAAGALAFGALGLLGLALGAVAVGRLAVGRARVGRMEIDHLVVGRVSELRRR